MAKPNVLISAVILAVVFWSVVGLAVVLTIIIIKT